MESHQVTIFIKCVEITLQISSRVILASLIKRLKIRLFHAFSRPCELFLNAIVLSK